MMRARASRSDSCVSVVGLFGEKGSVDGVLAGASGSGSEAPGDDALAGVSGCVRMSR
jgi:hypothetical protein